MGLTATEKEKKKKEPTFKKVKDGLIFISKGAVFVGLPTEVEKKGSIEGGAIMPIGGKGGGEKYSKTKYCGLQLLAVRYLLAI